MNGRQEAFCREYAACRDPAEAARRAGYRYPETAGARLVQKDEIQERVHALSVADRDEVRVFLTRALRSDGTLAERMKAAEMLLRCGEKVEKPGFSRVVIFGEEELE